MQEFKRAHAVMLELSQPLQLCSCYIKSTHALTPDKQKGIEMLSQNSEARDTNSTSQPACLASFNDAPWLGFLKNSSISLSSC
mmetsp:Transcript_112800/g.205020  ORF Transcript_112800/g.205020 Transcript_112800/m.205020 type:complete len:83 (-) Transcript_112800:1175-1423(-)